MALIRIIIALTLATLAAGGAHADAASPFLPLGEYADGPEGFYELCRRDLALCTGRPITEPTLTAAARMKALDAIGSTSAVPTEANAEPLLRVAGPRRTELKQLAVLSRSVNRAVLQRTDAEIYGINELWARPGRQGGDCEDIALEKRELLAASGFGPGKLFLGVVFRRGVGLHTVLIARLHDGDYVLDSLRSHVLRWDRTGYSWLRVQSPEDPLTWRRVG